VEGALTEGIDWVMDGGDAENAKLGMGRTGGGEMGSWYGGAAGAL